ncbi:MAG: hypothetical protein ACSLE0_02420 [Chitinophagaceae bacterium]
MYVKQFYTGCISEAAYYIESKVVTERIIPAPSYFPVNALINKGGITIWKKY